MSRIHHFSADVFSVRQTLENGDAALQTMEVSEKKGLPTPKSSMLKAPCFLFPEWCFSFPWGHFSRIGFFCPRGVFLFRSVFLVPGNLFFFVPGIGLSATGIGFLVPLGTFGARKGFSCARLK